MLFKKYQVHAGNPKINIMGAQNMVNLNFYYQNFHK